MTYFEEAAQQAGFIFKPGRSRISVKRAYIKGCPEMTCAGAPPLSAGPCDPFAKNELAFSLKRSEVPDHGFLQLQHSCRIVPRRDPQEEAGGFRVSAIWHRGRSGSLRDRGTAGGFAERRLSAGRRSPLRSKRHPHAV